MTEDLYRALYVKVLRALAQRDYAPPALIQKIIAYKNRDQHFRKKFDEVSEQIITETVTKILDSLSQQGLYHPHRHLEILIAKGIRKGYPKAKCFHFVQQKTLCNHREFENEWEKLQPNHLHEIQYLKIKKKWDQLQTIQDEQKRKKKLQYYLCRERFDREVVQRFFLNLKDEELLQS